MNPPHSPRVIRFHPAAERGNLQSMNPAVLLDKGLKLHRAGQWAEAAAIYRQVLERWPQHPEALHFLGLLLQKDGRHEEASELFARAGKANPKYAPPHLQRGFSLNVLGRKEEAAAAFKAAIARQANLSEAHHQLGNTYRALHRFPEAQASLREATRLAPEDAVIWLSRGLGGMETRQYDEAVECFRRAVQLDPALPEAQEILAQALMANRRNEEARTCLEAALRLRPVFAEAQHDLARICVEEGRLTEAAVHYRAALAINCQAPTYSNLLYMLHYLPEVTPAQLWAEHRQWAASFEQPLKSSRRPPANDREPNRKLRLGYVSPDLREHPVISFLEPILRQHDRTQFEVFGYSTVAAPDATTARLRLLMDQWRDIAGLDPEAAAELIRQDGIDILVDVAGHTTDHALLVFARKPAPVQVTWLGYPDTTGLEAMDYRVTDAISDPPGQTESWHSEQLLRLPQSFLCYGASAESPDVGPLPALANGYVTFGCFNNFRKTSEPAIQLWAQLLRALPTARLLLKSQGLDHAQTAQRQRDRLVRAGVDAGRIEIDGSHYSKRLHLDCYNRVDLALDPFPYHGTTTTCDALWMGVPVITLAGRNHVARVGTSLVTHLGFPEWSAETPEAYVAKGLELAGDLPALARLRSQLRERMRQSPLGDVPQFTGHLEAAYRRVWQQWCARPPA
jgi:predicted O-linked N-acetylglucosamine transferase (SPINDLY family)